MSQIPEDYLEEPLPFWAIGRTNGRLLLGAQLPTRDGRKVGNAHIINKFSLRQKVGEEVVSSFQMFTVLTDAGNRLDLTRNEVEERFYPPVYFSSIDRILKDFDRKQREEQ